VNNQPMEWCGVPVTVDDAITELFKMSTPDGNPDQKPEFRVTPSTAELVEQDFGLYKPSLELMVDMWQGEKERFMREKKANNQ
jgi:hypothetical protein